MRVLGISAYYHDAAAALVEDGRIVAAAQEERFSRHRHDARFPRQAVRACLGIAGASPADVDVVAFYDKPFLRFERLVETCLAFVPQGFDSFRESLPAWLRDELLQRKQIIGELRRLDASVDWAERLVFSEHHMSHAASAFYPSPFRRAAVLVMDGAGEWATTSVGIGDGRELAITREIEFPHSIGLLYSAFTDYIGFRANSAERDVMALAPYGVARYAKRIRDHVVDIKEDGSFRLNLDYFECCTGAALTNAKFCELLGGAPRRPDDPLTQREMDLAASIQAVTEEILLKLARGIARETGERNLCMAGEVALNCTANGMLARDGCFGAIWIQPAAGDAGGALGAALPACHLDHGQRRDPGGGQDAMQGAYLGPEFPPEEIRARLAGAGAVFEELDDDRLIDACAGALQDGMALGWFQGRMEFGPQALGARSILGDARSASTQRTLNLKIKFRESFRPFVASVLSEDAAGWFQLASASPYALLAAGIAESRRAPRIDGDRGLEGIARLGAVRSVIPAVTHIDYSARVHTVHRETNPRFHRLISRFKAKTGCPVVADAAFRLRGEPIVGTPEDAFRCFMRTNIERLAIGNCYLRKDAQVAATKRNQEYAVDAA